MNGRNGVENGGRGSLQAQWLGQGTSCDELGFCIWHLPSAKVEETANVVEASICLCPLQRVYRINIVTQPNILDTQDIFIEEMDEIFTLKFLIEAEWFINLLDPIAFDINTTRLKREIFEHISS